MIKQVILKFDKINNSDYIVSIVNDTNTFWYKYEVICSISPKKKKLLKSQDMILIPQKLKNNILKNIEFKEFNKKSLEKKLESNKHKYIDIVCENIDDYIIYYALTKIIKT